MNQKPKNPNKPLSPKSASNYTLVDTYKVQRGKSYVKSEKYLSDKTGARSKNLPKVSTAKLQPSKATIDSATRSSSKEGVTDNLPLYDADATVQELINRIQNLSDQQTSDRNDSSIQTSDTVIREEKATLASNFTQSDKDVLTENLSDTDTSTLCPQSSVNEMVKQTIEKNIRLQVIIDDILQARERERYELAWRKYMNDIKNLYSTSPLDTFNFVKNPSDFSRFCCPGHFHHDVPQTTDYTKLTSGHSVKSCRRCFATYPFYFDQASYTDELWKEKKDEQEKLTDGLCSYCNVTRETSTHKPQLCDGTMQCPEYPVKQTQNFHACECPGNKPIDGSNECYCDDKKTQTCQNCDTCVTEEILRNLETKEKNFDIQCQIKKDNRPDTMSLFKRSSVSFENLNKNADIHCCSKEFVIARKAPRKENFTQCNIYNEKHLYSGLCHKMNIRRLEKIETKLDLLLNSIDSMIANMRNNCHVPAPRLTEKRFETGTCEKPCCQRNFNRLPPCQREKETDQLTCDGECKLNSVLTEMEKIFSKDDQTELFLNNKTESPCGVCEKNKEDEDVPNISIFTSTTGLAHLNLKNNIADKECCTDLDFDSVTELDYDTFKKKISNKECSTSSEFQVLQCVCNVCSNRKCTGKPRDKSKTTDLTRSVFFDKRRNAIVSTSGLINKTDALNEDICLLELASQQEKNSPNHKPRAKEVTLKIVDSFDLIRPGTSGIKKDKLIYRLSNITPGPFKYNADNLTKSVQKLSSSKEDVDKDVNQLREQFLRQDLDICFDIPTRDVSTVITASLSKAQCDAKLSCENKLCPMLRSPMTKGINTDPLGFPALLGILPNLKKVLPNLSLEQFLPGQLLQMLNSPNTIAPYQSKFVCSICGETFQSSTELCHHINRHSFCLDKVCKICHRKVDNTPEILKVFTCRYCGMKFARAYCCEWHEQKCAKQHGKEHDVHETLTLLK